MLERWSRPHRVLRYHAKNPVFLVKSESRTHQRARLKNWTARSCFSAAARVANVPRLRRLPVFGFFLRE